MIEKLPPNTTFALIHQYIMFLEEKKHLDIQQDVCMPARE